MSDETVETRVTILEVRGEMQAEKLDKIEESLKETHSMVFSIKERLDKQNGIIPHMADDIKQIKDHQDNLADEQSNLEKEQIQDGTKLKAMWAILGAIGGGLLSVVIKLLFPH